MPRRVILWTSRGDSDRTVTPPAASSDVDTTAAWSWARCCSRGSGDSHTGVDVMVACRVLNVSRSDCDEWLSRPESLRTRDNELPLTILTVNVGIARSAHVRQILKSDPLAFPAGSDSRIR